MKELDQVSLVVDPSSLRKGSRGGIHGKICLSFVEGTFPTHGWTDFVVPVGLAWLDAIYSLAAGKANQREVHFMDGPFRVKALVAQERVLRLQFIENRLAGDRVHAEVDVDGSATLLAALSTADTILAECRNRGWEDDDTRSFTDAREHAQTGFE